MPITSRASVLRFCLVFGAVPASPAIRATARSADPARSTVNFDADWRFLKADADGAQQPAYDDAAWRTLQLPHDWSIEGPFDQHNPTGGAGAFLPAGIGWYRKHFTLPVADADRRVFIEFDGVMANSDVWINGYHLGRRPYGYVSFAYEMTGHLRYGPDQSNVLAVRVDDSHQPASRWYEGAGIYRHARLVITQPVHLEHWGVFVTTPQVSADHAVVEIRAAVRNQSAATAATRLHFTLVAPDGHPVGTAKSAIQSIPAGQVGNFDQTIQVRSPDRWDIDHPVLYRLLTDVRTHGVLVDDQTTPFGIRDAHFDAATGFWLNGRNLKIKGVCLHDDASALGMAVPLSAWQRRLAMLKQLGVNAIRTAHNPPAPEFLDLCDRMGFLVMDELFDCWTVGKNPFDYHQYFDAWSKTDVRDTVRRDRNHPSVILYSAGNEIHDTPDADLAKHILAGLLAVFHENDPTRPVTQALLRPNRSHDYTDGLADMLDVIGTNYRYNELIAAHEAKPTRKIIGTENRHDAASWLAVRDTPFYSGEFIWSGIDYLGESWFWPNIANSSGLLDRTGRPHPDGYQFACWWSDRPMVHMVRRVAPPPPPPTDPGYGPHLRRRFPQMFTDWTPANAAPHQENVEVYSNCDQVELVLNGRSLGMKDRPADLTPRSWQVPYEPGTLQAVGRNNGKVVAATELRTAGTPARLELATEIRTLATDWDSVAYVTATVVDEHGIRVPSADNPVTFSVNGPGKVIAVDSADNASHEPFQAAERRAFRGRCLAILRATAPNGKITVTVSAPGLASSAVEIQAVPVAAQP